MNICLPHLTKNHYINKLALNGKMTSESIILDESLVDAKTIEEVTKPKPKLETSNNKQNQSFDLNDKNQALDTWKRRNIAVLYFTGSHFNFGYQIGRNFGNLIGDFIEKNENMTVSLELYETEKGKLVYNASYEAISMRFPEYIRELKGIAEGSRIPFYKIFLLHLEDIMFSVLDSKINRVNEMGACMTLVLNSNERILAHIQDSPHEGLGCAYVVRARITETCPAQEFTALCVGGLLPGSQMAFNSAGVLLTVNPIDVRRCNETGIPLLASRSIEQIEETALCRGFGVSNGMSLNVVFLHDKPKPNLFNIEIGPHYPPISVSAKSTFRILPPKSALYYHFHRYQRLTIHTALNPSSEARLKHRWNVVRKSPQPSSSMRILDKLGEIVSGSPDDRKMTAVAIGVFNLDEMTWSLYTDNPKETSPLFVLQLTIK